MSDNPTLFKKEKSQYWWYSLYTKEGRIQKSTKINTYEYSKEDALKILCQNKGYKLKAKKNSKFSLIKNKYCQVWLCSFRKYGKKIIIPTNYKTNIYTKKEILNNHYESIIQLIEKYFKDKKKDIYFIQEKTGGFIKIGSSHFPSGRLKDLQTASPRKLKLIATIPEGGTFMEIILHAKFSRFKVSGEWYNPDKILLKYIDDIK